MATQVCPNCQLDSFSWSIDEEESLSTKWGCHECGYIAFEDESLLRECAFCYKKIESQLKDKMKKYWWCSTCNKRTDVDE